jgi:hypothetical protein
VPATPEALDSQQPILEKYLIPRFNRFLSLRRLLGCLTLLLIGFSSIGTSFAEANSIAYYIAPNGNDAWSGELATPSADQRDGPLATLDAARLKVRERLAAEAAQPIEVLIRGGEYTLDATVVFTVADSGREDSPVTYRAYPGEQPIFTGGKRLDNWTKLSKNPSGAAKAAAGKLWAAEVPDSARDDWRITSLYDGLELLPRSSSPEFKASEQQVLDPYNAQPKDVRGKTPDDAAVEFSREFRYRGQDLKDWKTPSDIELFLSPKHGWLINLLPLERIDSDTNMAHLAIDPTYGIRPGNKYYVENAIEYLDQPGEWAFDSAEGRVYIWPDRALNQADMRAPYLQEFIRVEGIEDEEPVRHLHFSGLTFRHGLRDTWQPGDKGLQHDWGMYDKGTAALRFRHAEHCSVDACTFEASSGAGVRLDLYAQRIKVINNRFSYLGGTGVLLSGYAPGTKDENKFNTVKNNYFHNIGTLYKHSPGIFIAQSGHNIISHNTIHDLAYSGILVSGCRPHEMFLAKPLANRREWVSSLRMEEVRPFLEGITAEMLRKWWYFDVEMIEPLLHARENLIEFNEIYNVMLELHDGNGLYFSGMGKNNIARFNYFHDIHRSRGNLRLDDISAYTVITNNVVHNSDHAFQIKGPAKISNNFAINVDQIVDRRFTEVSVKRNIFYHTDPGGADHTRWGNKLAYDFIDHWTNSIIYDREFPIEFKPEGDEPLIKIKLGDNIGQPEGGGDGVALLVIDPRFDEAAFTDKVFRFLPGSPAPDLGIEPIDLSEVGSTLAK